MALRLVTSDSERDAPASPRASEQASAHRALPSVDSLFRRYSPYVAMIATRLLGRDDEVDDVVQDVFLAATRGIGEVADPLAIRGWLATVTVRVARKKLRTRLLAAWVGLDRAPNYERVASNEASPEQRALIARIYGALDALPANHRIAWALRYLEGQGLDFVAESCGCSLATAKRYVSAAQAKITEVLRDE